METLFQQLYAFAVAVAAGAALGAVYDVFRVVKDAAGPRSGAASVSDLLYWAAAAPLAAGFLLYANRGELRFYVVLGAAVGLALYFALLSPLVVAALLFIGRGTVFLVSLLMHLVWGFFTWPVMLARSLGFAWRARGRSGGGVWSRLRTPWRPTPAWRRR